MPCAAYPCLGTSVWGLPLAFRVFLNAALPGVLLFFAVLAAIYGLGVFTLSISLEQDLLEKPPRTPSRTERRQQFYNLFITGLGPKVVVLRPPPGANGEWVLDTLRRRHLIPPPNPARRLAVLLTFCPEGKSLLRVLHPFQNLLAAGICKDGIIDVRLAVRGGARSGKELQSAPKAKPRVCPSCQERFTDLGLSSHRAFSKNPYCMSEKAVRRRFAELLREKRKREADDDQMDVDKVPGDSQSPMHDAMDVDESGVPSPTGTEHVDPSNAAYAPRDLQTPGAGPSCLAEAKGKNIAVDQRGEDSNSDDEDENDAVMDRVLAHLLKLGLLDGVSNFVEGTTRIWNGGDGGGGGGDGGGGGGDRSDGGGGDGGGGDGAHNIPPVQDPPPSGSGRRVEPYRKRAGEPLQHQSPPGHPFTKYESELRGGPRPDNPYYPFANKIAWKLAEWSKDFQIGVNAFGKMLKIAEVPERLTLNYHTAHAANDLFNQILPPRPGFVRTTYTVDGVQFECFMRNTLDVVRELYGRPEFANSLVFAPEKHFIDHKDEGLPLDNLERYWSERVYSEIHTAKWWWGMQDRLEALRPGSTIVPLIFSSDKTQLAVFRNRLVYPVYLTIGNIPKHMRSRPSLHAQILVAYLPVTRMKHVLPQHCARAQSVLFHDCMRDVVRPLIGPGEYGVRMTSGDGVRRRCYPILCAYVGDYPEQCLVAGVKYGRCPKGRLRPELFGTLTECRCRSHNDAVDALRMLRRPNKLRGLAACKKLRIKPIQTFWEDMPHADIYQAITPDILHQLLQGMVKHNVSWIQKIFRIDQLDARFKVVPSGHQHRVFHKGISLLSRVSGSEHLDICRVLLGVIADMPIPGKHDPTRIVRLTRALLDFLYVAQYPELSDNNIAFLDKALECIHANKQIVLDLKAHDTDKLDFPKLHAMAHYPPSIRLLGSPDNFNTAHTERLHIDLVGHAWDATNKKDELPQMVVWLQRLEQVHAHRTYIDWRLRGMPDISKITYAPPARAPKLKSRVTNAPYNKHISFAKAESDYGAGDFERVLKEFVYKTLHPTDKDETVANRVKNYLAPFHAVWSYNRLKFWHTSALDRDEVLPKLPDSVLARPAYVDEQGRIVAGQFQTALIDEFGLAHEESGVMAYRPGQIRLVFSLSNDKHRRVFGDADVPRHFAYIEWFEWMKGPINDAHRLRKIKRSYAKDKKTGKDVRDERLVSILPIDRVKRSISLVPALGDRDVPKEWRFDNVLKMCDEFWLTPYSDKHAFVSFR